jgi:radical SAM protein with 4Fe4S-binding SPASM domain
LREEFASILLTKMLTPFPTGFVDLQSPAGLGISGIVVNYDGAVYPSDEARMLAEMGDRSFRMGSVLTDSYANIMLADSLLTPLTETMTEGVPGCVDCGFQPYCGSDPVRHYRVQGDFVGYKPTSEFCRKHMSVIHHLVGLLADDERACGVIRGWI